MEILKENVRVRELEIVQMGSQLVMVAVMSDGIVDVYRNIGLGSEGFRFKLVEAQVLRKAIGVKGEVSPMSQMVHIVQDQVVVLDPQNAFMITQRKSRLYFHKFRPQLNIASIASLRLSKTSKEQLFIYVNQKQSTLNMLKIPLVFDPRASPECVNDFVIK